MVSKNQNGIGHLVLFLLVLVVTIGGLVGWRVIGSDKKTQTGSTSSSNQTKTETGKIDKIDTSKLAFDKPAATSDPFNDRKGPFYHDVYLASSTDGVHFSNSQQQIINKASVPDAIKLPAGQLVIYAVDGGQRSVSGLLVAASDDNGKTWKAGSLQVKTSRTAYSVGADPQVLLTDDGKLRLYYLVFPGPPTSGQPPTSVNKVYSATSSDGLNFTEEQGVRFEYAQITDPDVIKIGTTWFMYAAQGQTQIYATSTNGSSFTYKGVTRQKGSVSKTIALSDGKYRQFYCADGISSSTTSDGINWMDEGVNLAAPAGKIICDPSPIQLDDGSWLMVYKAAS
ncbi:TPA: hypothetical protein DIS56_00305 [Candidatus Saccharibacteria bacterium]|nr:MAG: hypothetical protein UX30_C0002G0049 [Candidatus Saccharibacteria bacterium GW2011_GWA2_46_10]HCM51570.1 hypothetical protein [Candidatus Saccharibacteria bacterium]